MTAMTLRLPDELAEALRHEAEAGGLSANNAAVTAISEWLTRRADERADALFVEVARDHSDLLHRLGTA